MIGRLGTLALVLAASLAMCAVTAAAATAQGQLTADGPMTFDGTDVAGQQNAFTTFGGTTECPDSSYHGETVGGGRIEAGASEFTLLPEFNSACNSSGVKATAHANGCDYVVHIGEALGEEEHAVTFDLLCPEGQTIDFEVFASSKNENIKSCTVLLGSQTGLKGAALKDIGKGEYRLTGTLEGLNLNPPIHHTDPSAPVMKMTS